MILKKHSGIKSLVLNFLQEHLFERSIQSDISQAFYISRRGLTVTRAYLFIYSLISLCFMIYQCTDYHRLLSIPYWSFGLQTVYFGIVLVQSIKGRKSTSNDSRFGIVGIMYELVFSFQLFNFLYYWLVILPKEIKWDSSFIYNFAWLSVTVLSFIAIWIEQLFNMMKLNTKHILLVIGSVLGNLGLCLFVSFLTGESVYVGINLLTGERNWIMLLLVVAPALHFLVGNKHYQHKRLQKIDRRKKLTDALVSFKAVKERGN